MAFILVLALHILEAYSSMHCQIVVLHVQSKLRNGMSAMQALHGVCQIFVKAFRLFRPVTPACVAFHIRPVVFCKCKMKGQQGVASAKAIGGCSLFVLALVARRRTGARCGSSASIQAYETLAGA
ncbi:MAG: hypothetical protein KGZ77_17975 [Rhodobacteraceae bacterium]|nr:hypothetical protein [Paracoccaceae bacterium]